MEMIKLVDYFKEDPVFLFIVLSFIGWFILMRGLIYLMKELIRKIGP